jgi:MFS family permease
VLTNLLVGFLCVVDWHLAFLSYGTILILLLIAVFFLKEPNDDSSLSASEIIDSHVTEEKCSAGIHSEPNKSIRELPGSVIILCLVYMGTMCIWGVAGLNLSVIIESKGFGDSATAGAVISLINISGMLAGFAFGGLSKIFGRYVLPFGCFLMAAGFIIYYLSPNVYVLSIGMFVAGLANTVIITSFEAEVGSRCSASLIAMGMSLCMIASQFSGFITPFYINFVMDVLGFASYSDPLAISAVCLIVIGACFAFAFAKQKTKETKK